MATFRLPAIIVSQTFNEDDDPLTVQQRNNQTLIIETSADDGFFRYGLDPDDPNDPTPLQPATLTEGNITALEINGERAEGAEIDNLDLFVNRIRFDGQVLDVLTIDVEVDDLANDAIFVVLNGADFPNIGSPSRLEDFVADASFDAITTGPFRPGARIDLEDIPGATFTPTPIELGPDAQLGTEGADELEGTTDADGIDGLGGNDVIDGLGGADTIFGSGGADTISGGGGKDVLFGNGGRDMLEGNGGRDRLEGNGGRDVLEGGGGKDALNGGGGKDMLDGGGGKDDLDGGGGRDTLEGGRGKDELTGGGGRDFFLFSAGDGTDTITDFRDRQDRIMIDEGAEAFADLTITQVGDDALVRFANVRITIEDTDTSTLSGADFIFS